MKETYTSTASPVQCCTNCSGLPHHGCSLRNIRSFYPGLDLSGQCSSIFSPHSNSSTDKPLFHFPANHRKLQPPSTASICILDYIKPDNRLPGSTSEEIWPVIMLVESPDENLLRLHVFDHCRTLLDNFLDILVHDACFVLLLALLPVLKVLLIHQNLSTLLVRYKPGTLPFSHVERL
jgi:hypothetical protein